LVARALAARGVTVGHIRHDGGVDSHAAIERRLLDIAGGDSDLFATGQDGRLAAAYRRRARAVAYRRKGAIARTATKAPDRTANKKATVTKKTVTKKKCR
jgi:hypothetical protein